MNTETMMTEGQPEDQPAAEDDAALWSLLERAPRPKAASPYFARRVLREVAALEEAGPVTEPTAPGWLVRLWQTWHGQARGVFAGALGAVALLAVSTNVLPRHSHPPTGGAVSDAQAAIPAAPVEPETTDVADPSAEAPVAAQDVEVIADLDNLLSSEESRLWTDEDTTARF